MNVFIDSNQFIADFRLESAPLRYLFHYLNNSDHKLLVSKLVIEEVENKHRAQVQEALADAVRLGEKMTRLGFSTEPEAEALIEPRLDLAAELQARVNDLDIIDYAEVPHDEVVRRALSRRKPFDLEGKDGYRDSLIWLSLLRHIERTGLYGDEVAFISDNRADFYDQTSPKERQQREDSGSNSKSNSAIFHEHLLGDIKNFGCALLPFTSVTAFVNTKVDKSKHEIDISKCYDLFESFLEEEGLGALGRLEVDHGGLVLGSVLGLPANALTILSSDAETTEGLEDLDIELAEPVDGEVFISCTYNIRGVSVDLHVPTGQFEEFRARIERCQSVWDVSRLGATTAIRLLLRPYFDATFRFKPKSGDCTGYSVSDLRVR